MFAAALLDAGVPVHWLERQLKKIPGLAFSLKTRKERFHSIRARKFKVMYAGPQKSRSWKQIRELLRRSRLAREVKETGIEIFARLASAEAKIHGGPVDAVHFHEVGAIDSIVDIMAAAVGVHKLGIDSLHFSRVPLGRGMIQSRHGPLPVPGPATLELLKGIPTFGIDLEGETVTPTGAAILAVLGRSFGDRPLMTIEKTGYGGGENHFSGRPNVFRLTVGKAGVESPVEEMLLVETNIDDMNPQLYDHVMELLLEAGARDVFLAPIQMKKNRPATQLSVICDPARRDTIAGILFQETTTIGVRYHAIRRLVLPRQSEKIKTRFGTIAVKFVIEPDGTPRAMPEYDDLKRIAVLRKLPLRQIRDEILRILQRK